jgi:hypothetical protein
MPEYTRGWHDARLTIPEHAEMHAFSGEPRCSQAQYDCGVEDVQRLTNAIEVVGLQLARLVDLRRDVCPHPLDHLTYTLWREEDPDGSIKDDGLTVKTIECKLCGKSERRESR